MEAPKDSSKTERGTSNRTSLARRETSSSSSSRQPVVHQQSRREHQNAKSGRSTRPEAFYASVEPLSVRRGLHNFGVERGPDPDTIPNSSGISRGGYSEIAKTSGGQRVQRQQESASLPRRQRDSGSTSGRRVGNNGNDKISSQDEYIKKTAVGDKYYAYHEGISRRDIIERRRVGSQNNNNDRQHHQQQDDNAIERFAQTLRNRWKQRTIVSSVGEGCSRENTERIVNNNNLMPDPCLEERPRTLPSIVRKSRGRYVDSCYNDARPDVLLPEGRRISRQDILNRRTSSFGGNNTTSSLIRRKSSGAIEVAGLSLSGNFYANDERTKCDEFVKRNSGYVKNASGMQQRSSQREQQQSNAGRKRRDASMERNRAGGSRSVADFITVPSRLRDMTRGLVPRPSTLPKIVHTSRSSRNEADWTEIGKSSRDLLSSREAPIYGRIRRRKLSLPVVSRDSQIRQSTGSLARSVKKSNYSNDNELEVIIVDKSHRTGERDNHTRDADFLYQRKIGSSQPDMRIDSKKNPIYGRVLRTNTSSSRSSSQTTGGARGQEVKGQERRGSIANDGKSSGQPIVIPSARELRQVSRRRIIDNVEIVDTSMSKIASSSTGRLQTRSMREIDYATIDFGTGRSAGISRRREIPVGSRRDRGSDEAGVQRNNENSDDRGKRDDARSRQEISARSGRSNHASTTLPLYARGVRKSSSCPSSNIPLKIATKSSAENRQQIDGKNSRGTTKSAKDRTNYVKKSVAVHVKSFSEANSPRSMSPAPSSSIFGFCTGRRRVRREQEKKNYRAERSSSRMGELVWFDPGVGHVLPGEVLEYHRAANVLSVQAVIAGKPQTFTLTNLNGVRPRQDLGQNGVEDMIQLNDLNEASLLWNLKIRYDKELIYTYTGSILVAVNPYKMFDIYGLDQVKLYEGRILGTLPPHLFAVGSSAYSQVSAANNSSANQVVVISGESGSGKTESTKLVMQYLAAVNRAPSNLVTEQILEAAPLLESFGNAKTPRNDNSSRFGKYLEVHFRDGVIVGGRVTQYLLEKSRIVTQAAEERNYHVFYELLAGLDQQLRDKYGLLTPDKYFYLNQGGNCEIDGKNDTEDFKALLSAMQVLGFTSEEQDTIFKILSSVLHLGNVYFHRKQMRHGQEGVEVGSDAEIRWAAHLLQVNADGIIRALTTKTTEARNERVLTALNIDQALDARDAFAKALYSSLFSWLVARVNHIVYKGTKQTAAISILDIFGFENFAENSFEQLCINYANENLHFYFNKHIFKLEQQEYAKEKIDWTTINYTDNLPVIHLIAKKPVGILHLLDDESNFPKATDLSFLEKCHYNHALSELYSRPRMNSAEFAIKHYAGQVWYNVEGFLDKNRDTLRPDVVELLISSKIQMVSKMFQHVRTTHEANKTVNKPNGRFVTMKPRTPTVSARFHDSLQQLLDSMSQCNPWFVRCIKPNMDKAPMKFDMPCVLEQLRYTGMLETICIRKTGYPVRLQFGHFVDRYRYLIPNNLPRGAPNKELCRIILDKAARQDAHEQYQLGLTRVFLRESLERNLEYNRALILERAAITVQRYTRGFLERRRFLNIARSTIFIQAVFRGYRDRKKFRALLRGVLMAQKMYRGKKEREIYKVLKEEMAKRAEMERASRERAKAKQQREEQERASRAVAGVNHLEIPAELAFIYSKLDDWQPTHTERNLVKVVGTVIPMSHCYNLPTDIDQHQFSKFTNIYFKSHIFGMKREPIKTPFLAKARDQDYTDSLMMFKMILRFMNENNLSGKREQALGDYIVNKGIVNEKLRDEILCQLANQTWKNENDGNKERGWLLLANCLSSFQPSSTLFKYFLKYVSDHAYDGYKAYCQRKLLQGERTMHKIINNNQPTNHHVPRTYPPCVLEWRANRNRVNMALNVGFYDGETMTCAVDSWTTCEEIANLAVRNHGVENSGWTITLWNQLDAPDAIVTETNGLDYCLDLISEMELAPAFPAAKHMFLEQRKNSFPPIKKREHAQAIRELEHDLELPVLKTFQPLERKPVAKVVVDKPVEPEIQSPRRPAVPPPQPPIAKSSPTRKQSHEPVLESTGEMGLSRQSALNDRYFEKEKQRSRSLDNLLQPEVVQSPSKLATLGLSSSKLNERYHSLERVSEVNAVSNVEYMSNSELTQERKYSRITRTTEPNIVEEEDLTIDFEYPDIQSVSQTGRSEDDKNSYVRSQTRFIKSQYPGKRALPGSQSSRAYIEKSEYGVKSSAMSDTSEAPSLASHVRRVRVPSQASDVDQFLDELFMPVLDGNLDELSDARSLAASIKGTSPMTLNNETNLDDFLTSVSGTFDLGRLLTASEICGRIKGGGNMDIPNQNTPFNPSLASHVRRVRVSSQASDVDQFLDELFMPVLDGNLDELSDARSLAASIKGTSPMTLNNETNLDDFLTSVSGTFDLGRLLTASDICGRIKGGGNMDIPNQNTAFNPSLASHVRRVRVPSQASDVDQFSDELFMPVLDGNLDELSDARSLAASIKGTSAMTLNNETNLDDFLTSVSGTFDLGRLLTASEICGRIKGGGNMDIPNQNTAFNPSLASHVRRVRVPSQASDVDQFLDELFMPVLDGNLDELSDARSVAASIKGTSAMTLNNETNLDDFLTSVSGTFDLGRLLTASEICGRIKGGGNMDIPNQNTAFNFSPLSPGIMSPPMMMPMFSPQQQMPTGQNPSLNMGSGFMPIPIYNMQGMNLPQYPNSPPSQNNDMAAYQQNLQRAFLQSAMAQNMQIQQQLLAQNQALQQLLVQNPQNGGPQSGTFVDGEQGTTQLPSHNSTPTSSRQEIVTVKAQVHRSQSPPRKALELGRKTSVEYSRKISIDRKPIERKSSTNAMELKRTSSGRGNVASNFTNVLSELKNRKSSVDSNGGNNVINGKGVPPPPPMPPPLESHDPSESRPFLDPYGRAKTVRIGKWRWPPPSDSNEAVTQDNFMEFKMRQHQQQRKITPQYQDYYQVDGQQNNNDGSVDWEEFEIENGQEERRDESHGNSSHGNSSHGSKHENGLVKDDGEKKKKKSKSGFEVGAHRPSPGSIGKLKLSSEMRQRLEKVTANHSVRSTKTTEKPALPREDGKVKRLEDNRKLLLEQQLAGRWDDYASTADDTQSVTSKGTTDMMTQAQVVRTQIERMERPVPPPPPISPPQPPSPRGGSMYSNSQSGVAQPRSPPAPVEPKIRETNVRSSPDSDSQDNFPKNQHDMFSQSRDLFASQQHLRESHEHRVEYIESTKITRSHEQKATKDYYGKDSTDVASTTRGDRSSDFDSRRDHSDVIFDPKFARDMFETTNSKRDSFGMSRDLSPKSRDSFGMPSSREFGVVPNTRESFVVARQSFKKLDNEIDRRSSIASTHRTDKMERIEIEEWPEFLRPVLPPAEKPEIEKVQEIIDTKLYPPTSTSHFTYNRVTWALRVKKEVFTPNETLASPLALHLVFCQIAYDVLATSSIRINKEDRQNMLKLLDNYGVTLDNLQSTQHKITIKKNIVDLAKQWPLYFARIFPVSIGPQHPEAQHVAVSHHGLRLIKRNPSGDLSILETLPLEEIVSVGSTRAGVCTLQIASGVRLPLHTTRAPQLAEMIGNFIRVIDQKPIQKSNHHDNHVTQITKSIQSHGNHSSGIQQYSSHNQTSHNQANNLISGGNHEIHTGGNRVSGQHGMNSIGHQTTSSSHQQKNQRNLSPSQQHHNNHLQTNQQEWRQPEENIKLQEESFYESGPVVNDGKHSLLQYAMLNFRQSTEKFEMMKTADGSISGSLKVIESLKSKKKSKKNKGQQDGAEWTWKEQVDLVKYSQVPIEQSLLRLDSELSLLAVECFMCLMRYMGDQPLPPDMSEVKCVYTILMHCHKFEPLRDEVYCQLMKQTTNNKSPNPESCQRGWRLFSIVAAYFTCSEGLRAYLIKYLETAAYDKRRAYHGTATVCLQNLRKTVKYGGRKNVPSVEEIMAISAGRNAKRQIYRLPGGTERVINTKCTTVVQDVIEEMCNVISVRNPHEMDEFSLYCIVDGDAFTMPLARDEYVLDVTTELHKNHQVFYLIFCRSVWYYPLRLDAALYIEVVFNQIAPDYLEGLLLVLPGEHLPQEVIYDMAQIAALLHRAADMAHEPTTKEIKYLLPKPALSLREPRPQQWGNLVQQAWNNIQHNTAAVCKAQVLEILSKWPLFGSSFFAVKRVPENGKEKGGDHILALNRHGVHFIDLITHETLYHYPYSEVISTRKVKSEEGTLYLDMKCGNLMQQRITRLQTEQAHEISRLIRQYITMEQRTTNNQSPPIAFAMR